ncbi:hypothetical protein GCM10009007_08770 [Formosimonas limnophila]|uniref:Uncharacterized protein n=1 Tax=Formosimonas limnophila TaxID=1384487 RepID=A0A8J3CH03_9BURK|nr:hypothetical protein GCM10009007_08770 [Formosimonas limnophila]
MKRALDKRYSSAKLTGKMVRLSKNRANDFRAQGANVGSDANNATSPSLAPQSAWSG